VKAGGVSVERLPQTFPCAGTSDKSCCTWTPTQNLFLPEDADSQTFAALHLSPESQSELVSHDLPVAAEAEGRDIATLAAERDRFLVDLLALKAGQRGA